MSHLKNIGIVSGVTMTSRVLGLCRDMLTTAVFGAGALNSAFVTAFTLPNLFRRLLGEGALTAAFIPTLQEEWKRGGRPAAMSLVNRVASWVLLATLAIAASASLLILAALALSPSGASALAARWETAGRLAVLLFPYVVFVCLSAVFSAALQVCGRFLEPALSPVWLNLSMIALLGGSVLLGGSLPDAARMRWLCAGVLLGGFFQMAVPAAALLREGWRPRLSLERDAPVRQIARLMLPMLFGSAVYLLNMAVSRAIGLSLNDAAATVLNLSSRLMELPIGVFAVAVTTVVFPLISRHAAAGDAAALAADYRRGMRLILMVNIPAAAGLAVLAEPVIRLLFQRGNFAAADTALMSPVLVVFACGLPFLSFVNLALRVFYARKDTRTPVRAALGSFALNVLLSLALMGPLSTAGLALAGNLAAAAQAFWLQRRLVAGDPALGLRFLARDLAKILAATAVMGLAVAAAARAWLPAPGAPLPALAFGVLSLAASGAALYGGLLWLLRVQGRGEAAALLRRRLFRR
ncbi:MAG: murein biosynthesis integral membrane protein MurJ [Opitutaceae bacterium]|jgi:putative peptidoglycan lipid II flippase|nr:murein biosynthesis integral membrane protein MurJ [Opitutaceae bacterium]